MANQEWKEIPPSDAGVFEEPPASVVLTGERRLPRDQEQGRQVSALGQNSQPRQQGRKRKKRRTDWRGKVDCLFT